MRLHLSLYGCLALLSGCQMMTQLQNFQSRFSQEAEQTEAIQQHLQQSVQPKATTQHVDQPWVVGKVQPLARELVLPAAFQANVSTTLIFQTQSLNLDQIA